MRKKVPMIMQMEALECGAASLCMILASYGKWLPLEQVRRDCGVSRDGSTAKNIAKAAQNYGLSVKAYRLEPEELKTAVPFPCILHWDLNHFVVLCGFKGDQAVINDPARGVCLVPPEELDAAFTGICLCFEEGPGFQKSGRPKSMVSFAKKRLTGARRAVVFVMLAAFAASVLGIVQTSFSKAFMDLLLDGGNDTLLTIFLCAATGFAILQLLVLLVWELNWYSINGRFAAADSAQFFWKVLHMPMEFFSQRSAGDIQLRCASNDQVAGMMVNTLAPLVLDAVMMVLYLVVMLKYSVVLTLLGVLSVIANLLLSGYISQKRVGIMRVMLRDEGRLASETVSGIEMIETIKASGAENGFFEKWSGYQASVNAQKTRYAELDFKIGFLPNLISSLTETLVLVLGAFLVMNGQFTPGALLAFQGFLTAFSAPAKQLTEAGQILQEMKSSAERIEDVMEYPQDNVFTEREEAEYDKLSGNIELRNVTFGYSPLAEPLIRDFSLTVQPGQKIAIVGGSGCGKSTLAKLISGLYKPWSGEILFDGRPLSDLDRSVFTGSLAVVNQDVTLFEDTIANNIKMWDSSIEDFEMIMAARDAQLHDDIIQRDGGYNYRLSEGGRDLSSGQRQRLEIARVLAQDPTILIMDEATSALDAKTEYEVMKSISDRGIASIVIAHRLSTIRDCDEIIVLDKGQVAERGTHDELYARGGVYTSLVSSE